MTDNCVLMSSFVFNLVYQQSVNTYVDYHHEIWEGINEEDRLEERNSFRDQPSLNCAQTMNVVAILGRGMPLYQLVLGDHTIAVWERHCRLQHSRKQAPS
jgi:hypothetical protein